MVRDLKTDCAKRTEEVCSGFCNIGSGVSLKRQKWHQKAKNCFLVFFLCSGWRKEGRQEQPLIDYKRAGMRETKWKLKNKENDVERERSVYVPFLCFWKMIKEGQWRKEWKRAYPWICRLLRICSGEAIEGTIPATQEYRDFVKNLHSKQILNMQVIIPFYEVRFQYETIRKNLRTGKKYFFASNGEHEDIDLEIGMKLENSVDYEKKLQENAIFRKYY